MRARRLVAQAAFFIAAVVKPAYAGTSIPIEFRGVWSSSTDHCGEQDDLYRLVVSAGELTYYYSAGPVKSVARRGARRNSVTATLSTIVHIDIDVTRTETVDLELSEPGSQLTVINGRRHELYPPPLFRGDGPIAQQPFSR